MFRRHFKKILLLYFYIQLQSPVLSLSLSLPSTSTPSHPHDPTPSEKKQIFHRHQPNMVYIITAGLDKAIRDEAKSPKSREKSQRQSFLTLFIMWLHNDSQLHNHSIYTEELGETLVGSMSSSSPWSSVGPVHPVIFVFLISLIPTRLPPSSLHDYLVPSSICLWDSASAPISCCMSSFWSLSLIMIMPGYGSSTSCRRDKIL